MLAGPFHRLLVCTGILVVAVVAQAGTVDRKALRALEREAEATHSSAVVVIQEGEVVLEWYDAGGPRPIEAMSATKSIVNLAIGRLQATRELQWIDLPVHTWFPEWRQGRKKDITVGHLLGHTSGLQNVRETTEEIYPAPDFVRLALAAELDSDPGTSWSYNNKAVNLLPAVVQRATGQRMDEWLREDLFAELGIADFGWTLDEAGNPHGMSGLQILPRDLAKLGELVIDPDQTLLPSDWMERSTTPGPLPQCGLLWWLVPAWERFTIDDVRLDALRSAGVDEPFVASLAQLKGTYDDVDGYHAELAEVLGDDWPTLLNQHLAPFDQSLSDKERGPVAAWAARGFLGQFLVVVPEHQLVAVRMIVGSEDYDESTDGFGTFERRVLGLVTD